MDGRWTKSHDISLPGLRPVELKTHIFCLCLVSKNQHTNLC
jgi:hypothetical protein